MHSQKANSNRLHCNTSSGFDMLSSLALDVILLTGAGIDFWWTDWQQGLGQGSTAVGSTDMATPVNPTMLLNHYRTFNPQPLHPSIMSKLRPNATLRGATHSRFGGLGGHRCDGNCNCGCFGNAFTTAISYGRTSALTANAHSHADTRHSSGVTSHSLGRAWTFSHITSARPQTFLSAIVRWSL